MVQTHLENFQSDHPIVAVALSATPVRPVSQQFGLFQTALRNPQQLFETLARLTALVGCDRVGTPVLEETHRPDAFRMEPFCWQIVESAVSSGKIERDSDAPRTAPARAAPVLRRFRPPASTSAFISDRRPALCVKDSSFQRTDKNQGVIGFEGAACETQVRRYLESTKFRGEIVHQTGPFLVSGNWWDEKAWARAEWDMQLEQGELVRAHEDASPARTWKLDGIYD
jgi:protein ImuB